MKKHANRQLCVTDITVIDGGQILSRSTVGFSMLVNVSSQCILRSNEGPICQWSCQLKQDGSGLQTLIYLTMFVIEVRF